MDGSTFAPMPPVQVQKQLLDGDQGPRTVGMGAYGPVPQVDLGFVHCLIRIYSRNAQMAKILHPFHRFTCVHRTCRKERAGIMTTTPSHLCSAWVCIGSPSGDLGV